VIEREEVVGSIISGKISNVQRETPMAGQWGIYSQALKIQPLHSKPVKTEFSWTVRLTKTGRTVRHLNPTARSAINVCQRRPLEPWRTVRTTLADRPPFNLKNPVRAEKCLCVVRGWSAYLGRTVHRSPSSDTKDLTH
jgi:hypothetical protein